MREPRKTVGYAHQSVLGQQVRRFPDAIRRARFHRRRNGQSLVNSEEVVIRWATPHPAPSARLVHSQQ